MFKYLKMFAVAASVSISISAMEIPESLVQTENPYLFELTYKKDVTKFKGYILGTQHNLSMEIFSLPVRDIINSAKTIFVESTYGQNITTAELESLGAFQKEEGWSWNNLSQEEHFLWHHIFDVASHNPDTNVEHYEIMQIKREQLKPWCVYGCLSNLQIYKIAQEVDYARGMDDCLHKRGQINHIKIIGLETQKDRLCSYGFNKMSDEDAIKNIKIILSDWEIPMTFNDESSKELTRTYLQGGLEALDDAARQEDGIINAKTTAARNNIMYQNWFNNLQTKGKVAYPFLIALGSAHLGGKDGFLQKISKNYYVRRVQNDGSLSELMTF